MKRVVHAPDKGDAAKTADDRTIDRPLTGTMLCARGIATDPVGVRIDSNQSHSAVCLQMVGRCAL